MKRTKKLIAIASALVMLLAGCGSESEVSTSDFDFEKYPIETEETLTYWCELPSAVSTVYNNLGDTEFAKELENH